MDHRHEEHDVSSLGTLVEAGDQGDQVPEHQQPENVGTASQVEPTPEVHEPSDQMLELLTQTEPWSEEIEGPTGAIG